MVCDIQSRIPSDATVTRAPRCNTPSQRVPGVAYVNKCVRYVDQPGHVLEYVGKSPEKLLCGELS